MNSKEAIEYLNSLDTNATDINEAILMLTTFRNAEGLPQRVIDNYDLVITALKKQIAKKPVVESYFELLRNGKAFEASCPTCGEGLTYFDNLGMKKIRFKEMRESIFRNHCPPCGQKIDWSDEECI